ncbi:ATP-binding protein, partial [bacterium]|nr:ATP-binding protein [bacterium]
RSLSAPPRDADPEDVRDRTAGTVSALLGLLGIEADPLRSREHVLLSKILEKSWSEGRDVELAALVREIASPSIERVGALDLESFYPAKERSALSLALNSLLASPGFSAWLEGEPLDVDRLLWTADGKPRLSIVSIAHLSEPERMFFVSLLLSEVLTWVRRQSGTSSLRAILYMDEVAGFFPPVATPPSKAPMLSLLKQARAYGLGVVLATQNPVDLDYKGLSNAGTWFLGRLQTERDKARVLDGLEGASAAAGRELDRSRTDKILSALGQRVFLMNDVHRDAPEVFQSRWALSYLRGPLTRVQVQSLMAERRRAVAANATTAPAAAPPGGAGAGRERPLLPHDVKEVFVAATAPRPDGASLVYRPALLAGARLHFVDAKAGIDEWRDSVTLTPLGDGEPDWASASRPAARPALESQPRSEAGFAPLPGAAARAKSYAGWQKSLSDLLYRTEALEVGHCPSLGLHSRPGEDMRDFQIRMNQAGHERRDAEADKIRARFAARIERARTAVDRAASRAQQREDELSQRKSESFFTIGANVIAALFSRNKLSATNIGRATTAARSIGRTSQKQSQVEEAEAQRAKHEERLEDVQGELAVALERIEAEWDAPRIEATRIPPRKTDVAVEPPVLAWLPSWVVDGGVETRAWG